MDKKIQIFIIVAAALVLLLLLQKFGLLFKSEDEKLADKLIDENAGKDFNDRKDLNDAAKKVTGTKKPSKEQILKLVSDSSTMERLKDEIYNAHGTFDDNEAAVYNAFTKLKSQYDVQMFSRFFQARTNWDLMTFLSFYYWCLLSCNTIKYINFLG